MKLRLKGKKISAFLMSAVIMGTSFAYSAPIASADETTTRSVDDIAADQAALEEEQAEIQAQIDALGDEETAVNEKAELLESQMKSIAKQIDSANTDIAELDSSISDLNSQLDAAEEEYADTIALFKERIKALYKTGSVGTLEVLLNADSYSDYMMKLEVMQSVSKHDSELVEKMTQFMDETKETRSELKSKKKEVAELKVTLEEKTEEINTLYEENKEALTELQEKKAAANSSLEDANSYADQLYNEMIAAMATPEPTATPAPTTDSSSSDDSSSESSEDESPVIDGESDDSSSSEDEEVYVDDDSSSDDSSSDDTSYDDNSSSDDSSSDNGSSSNTSGFYLTCPCPGYSYISAGFGGYEGHYGTDFAAGYGTAIVAAADGYVAEVNSTDEWGYSWGYYVYLYHNDTYSTRYAHMSSIVVSPGEYVTAGQVIGYVGLTGNTTGPHLHFELYQYGTRIDSASFF